MNIKKTYKQKAFTIVELLVVLALIAILSGLGFAAFSYLKDSSIAKNTEMTLETVLRDAQDKALTFSAYNSTSASANKGKWVYGYTIEYDPDTNTMDLFSIVDESNSIPQASTQKTQQIRTKYMATTCRPLKTSGTSFLEFTSPESGRAFCYLEKSYSFDTKNIQNSTCDILFTTVNAKASITGNKTTCSIQINQNMKYLTFTYRNNNSSGMGYGEVYVCDGNKASCINEN
ncbi:MAG: type II secretion system protein [bacterium]